MKKFQLYFIGRKIGSIGITYTMQTVVEAENAEAAKLKLYERFEHIYVNTCTEVVEPTGNPA